MELGQVGTDYPRFGITLQCTLPGGGLYFDKLFAWPGIGFYVHKLSCAKNFVFLPKDGKLGVLMSIVCSVYVGGWGTCGCMLGGG